MTVKGTALTRCESAIASITIYDKQNKILRPLLREYHNVEQKVLTQRLRDTTYQIVKELTDPVNDHAPVHPEPCYHQGIVSAPTMLNKFESAKYRELEYKGRPLIGENMKQKTYMDMIPPLPESIYFTENAESNEL